MPLVDIAEGGTGTQFWPGSHLERRAARFEAAIARSEAAGLWPFTLEEGSLGELEAPACPAGGILLFDMRLLHRGLPNTGERERAVLYSVCSTGGARDKINFPDESLREFVEKNLPWHDEEALRAERAALRAHFPTWEEGGRLVN